MGYRIIRGILIFVCHIVFGYKVIGAENIPKEGGAIMAYNHRSYWDLPFAGISSPRRMRFMAKSELFKNPIFGTFIKSVGAFPVHRGKGDLGAIRAALGILKAGELMVIFPQGKRVTDGSRPRAKAGIAMIASMAKTKVVPVNIKGTFKFRHRIIVTIGKPIDFSDLGGGKPDSKRLQQMADVIMDEIYRLEDGKPEIGQAEIELLTSGQSGNAEPTDGQSGNTEPTDGQSGNAEPTDGQSGNTEPTDGKSEVEK